MSLWRKVYLQSLNFKTKIISSFRKYHHETFIQKNIISKALREKEKGDWKNLTKDEKICLYRGSATISSTLEKVDKPIREWKSIMAWTMFSASLGFWLYIFILLLLVWGQAPSRFDREHRFDGIDGIDQCYQAIEELMKNKDAKREESK